MKSIKKDTQMIRLLKYLIRHGKITAIECFGNLGFFRPDRRIVEIRKLFGHDIIKTEMVTLPKGSTYAVYKLNRKYKSKVRSFVRLHEIIRKKRGGK